MKSYRLFLLVLVVGLFACGEDDETQPEVFVGYNYAPLEIGQEAVYFIDSLIYDEFTPLPIRKSFYRQEVVTDTIIDGEGRIAFNIEVNERTADSLDWKFVKFIRKTRTESKLEKLEENIPTVELIFPIKEGEVWNRNVLNTLESVEVNYELTNLPYQSAELNYDSTVTLNIRKEENLIERIETSEVYALNTGIILRSDMDLITDLDGNVRDGYEMSATLVSFKK